MQPIEIRYVKKLLFPLLLLGTMIITGITAYIFLSDEYKGNNTAKIVNIAGFALFTYFLSGYWRTVFNKNPVLVFTDNELVICKKGKPFSFSWKEIIRWKIEKLEDNGGYSLTIETNAHKENISLNWLEKPPHQIERLIREYPNMQTLFRMHEPMRFAARLTSTADLFSLLLMSPESTSDPYTARTPRTTNT